MLDERPAKFNPVDPPTYVPDGILFAPLIKMAVSHIDRLKDRGLVKLPWEVELFGRAHITSKTAILFPTFTGTIKNIFGRGDGLALRMDGDNAPPLPEMKWGAPVDGNLNIVTEHLVALLLYNDGTSLRVRPWRFGGIRWKAILPL